LRTYDGSGSDAQMFLRCLACTARTCDRADGSCPAPLRSVTLPRVENCSWPQVPLAQQPLRDTECEPVQQPARCGAGHVPVAQVVDPGQREARRSSRVLARATSARIGGPRRDGAAPRAPSRWPGPLPTQAVACDPRGAGLTALPGATCRADRVKSRALDEPQQAPVERRRPPRSRSAPPPAARARPPARTVGQRCRAARPERIRPTATSSRRMTTASSIAVSASSRRPSSASRKDWLFSDIARPARNASGRAAASSR
jgi:hypothetical protein